MLRETDSRIWGENKMIKFLCLLAFFLNACTPAFAATNTANVATLNTASTNVTTGAFVTLMASSAVVASKIVVANASTSVIKISYGIAGSETDLLAVGGSVTSIQIQSGVPFAIGTRFAVEAISATASSGYITLSLIP